MPEYKDHPLAAIFPLMESAELKELAEDILQNTQRAPITLYENKILDGRNRYRACLSANIEPRTRSYTGSDPQGFVISANLKRKHYNESQRAMVAARLAKVTNGGDRRSDHTANLPTEKSNARAAKDLNVSERTVRTAKTVLREAPKKEIKAIERGEKSVTAVAKQIKESKADKEILVDKFNRVVPDEIISEWQRAAQTGKKLQSLAREIKSILAEGFSGAKQDRLKDAIYAEINNSAISDAEALAWLVSSIIPFAICPTCQGFNRKQCGLCKKRGWVSKYMWNSPIISPETRAIIEGKS